MMDNWDDVVERALNKYERVVIAKLDATQAMRAAGRVFVEAALEEAAKVVEPKYECPCDCDKCTCGNVGTAEETASWHQMKNDADSIRAIKDKLPW